MLIHLGYHKTATTWLQQRYFPRHPQLAFIGGHGELFPQIILPHSLDFDPQTAKTFFQPRLEQAQQQGLVPVLSDETLSGNPHSGGYKSKEIADRLKQVFPDSKILIVIRHQPELILSNYKQYIRVGGICTLKEYMRPPIDPRIPLFRLEQLQFHKLATYYSELYGKAQVKVMIYEQFKREPQRFLNDLANFIGIDNNLIFPVEEKVHASYCDLVILLKRRINRWHGNDSLYPVTPPFPKLTQKLLDLLLKLDNYPRIRQFDAHFLPQIQGSIGNFYAESNQRLADSFQLDLAAYQYNLLT